MTSPVRCAVLGDPIDHSLSPVLHRAAYDALGLASWTYEAVRVPGGTLADFLRRPRRLVARAVADDAAQARAADARRRGHRAGPPGRRRQHAGARRPDVPAGGLADNTDLPGAAAAVRERWAGAVDDVVVLGGGATAASTALALCDVGRHPGARAGPVAAAGRRDGRRRRAHHLGRPDVEALALPRRSRCGPTWSSRPCPAAAQAPDAARPARGAGRLRGALRPVADPAGAAATLSAAPCSSAASTCWCTRPRCRSSSSPAATAPARGDARGRRARAAASARA